VMIATQRPETRGLLWPSKLALATLLPRPVLWVGPVDGAVAKWLQFTTQCGVFAPGDVEGIAAFVSETVRQTEKSSAQEIRNAARERALKDWLTRLDHVIR